MGYCHANFVIWRSTFIGFYRCLYGRGLFCIFHTSFFAVFIEIISDPGIICGPIWRSFVVRGSFAGLYRLHSLSLSVNYLFVTLRVWVRVLLHARIRVSFGSEVRRTPYDIYGLLFSPQVLVKVTRKVFRLCIMVHRTTREKKLVYLGQILQYERLLLEQWAVTIIWWYLKRLETANSRIWLAKTTV